MDAEVLATLAEEVFSPELTDEVTAVARQLFEERRAEDRSDALRRELAAIEREQARITKAIATSGDIPVLVERLRTTEIRRREVAGELDGANGAPQRLRGEGSKASCAEV